MIKLIRVDDRLLHGELCFFWTKHLHLKKILICNDEASSDDFTKLILDLAKPKEIELMIVDMKQSQVIIRQLNNEENSSIVIVSNLVDAQIIIEKGKLDLEINLGGLRMRPNCQRICDYVALSTEDILIIQKLLVRKQKIWICRAPKDEKIEINDI